MTVEPALAEQQRAVVELYIYSKWIKANLTLEDDNLYIEYAHDKRDQSTPSEHSMEHSMISTQNQMATIQDVPDTLTNQKRTVKIVKPDNTGLGTISVSMTLLIFLRFSHP
jgi:hypothetical protein